MEHAIADGARRNRPGGRAKRLPVDERRRRLLELGVEIFSENPYEDISTSEIAARAQISKGLLYHYFPSKRHFFLEAIREIGRRIDEVSEWNPDLDFEAAGYAALSGLVDFVDTHENMFRTLIRSSVGIDPNVSSIADERRQTALERVLDRLGIEDPPPVLRTGIRAWIGFTEAAMLSWLDHRDFPKQDLIKMLIIGFRPIVKTAAKLPKCSAG